MRGSLPTRKFMAFYMAEGRVESVVAINQGRDLRRALPIIKARVAVDPARLEDPNVDLRTLAPAEKPGCSSASRPSTSDTSSWRRERTPGLPPTTAATRTCG